MVRTRLLTYIFLVFLVTPAFAWTSDDLVLDPTKSFSPPSTLNDVQARKDIEYLLYAARSGYAGPSRLLNELARFQPKVLSAQDFCQQLAHLLAGVRDRHLKAFLNFQVCLSTVLPGGVGTNVYSGPAPWQLSWHASGKNFVAVLAIPTFANEDDAGWEGFLSTVRALRDRNAPFVIDLRGNLGGDDDYGFEMARILFGLDRQATLPNPVDYMRFVQTSASFAFQLNDWNYQIAQLRARGEPVPAYYSARAKDWRRWFERSKGHPYPNPHLSRITPSVVDPQKVFSQNVFVLIDRLCASACETTLQVLEGLPHRILVGENSMGAVQYGTVGILRLPNSHIAVQLATESAHYRDGRLPEKVGDAPDLRVTPVDRNDALNTALDKLRF